MASLVQFGQAIAAVAYWSFVVVGCVVAAAIIFVIAGLLLDPLE